MAVVTLLDVLRSRFGTAIDPDSDGGQILNSLTPHADFGAGDLTGKADGAPITFTPSSSGVSVRAAQQADALVFSLPVGPLNFKIVPPGDGNASPIVEIVLFAPTVPVAVLRPATLDADGLLREAPGKVVLNFPDLLLVVTASVAPPATARLAPSHNAEGALEVAMVPPFALIGPGAVLGLHFEGGILKLEPGDPEIDVPTLEVFVAPEGIPPLAMHGGGRDLRIGLGATNGGFSGEFAFALNSGAQAPRRPRFLREMAARVRLTRNRVTLLELTGQIALKEEVEQRLAAQLPDGPAAIDYRLQLDLDTSWKASLRLTAAGGGVLWRTQRTNPDQRDLVRDTLGAYAVFAPLLVTTLPGSRSSGFVDLALASGAAAGLAGSRWTSTRSLTLFGGELVVRQAADGTAGFLFFDIETELDLNIEVVGTRLLSTRRPLKVRQKSIGFSLNFGGGTDLKPVFDPSQGFSLDLSDPGTFDIPGPLGDILQPDKARVARQNPVTFEVDLISKVDLGIVTIDSASVRVPLDSPAIPTLTGLGARLDAGLVQGGGYLKILPDGIAGGFDASIGNPLGIRANASLRLGKAHDDSTGEDLTSVLAAFGVEWPVPIPLANSGLGLFGFLGLFGMHVMRRDPPGGSLQWLVNAGGDPAALPPHGNADWMGAAHHWAIGLGAVIGTLEGGFIVHAKGMLMIELPGPRILLMMKADLLQARPPKEGPSSGTLLAVIDVRPESITLGIVAEYRIPFLLEVRLPVEAFFNFEDLSNWHLDIGGIPGSNPAHPPASIKFMSTFRAEGYLLFHGNGIPDFPLRKLEGLSVATGVRAALTWGPEPIGLYIRVSASADLGLSFKPFLVIGKVKLEGELHLFIISIGASAGAGIVISQDQFYVEAEVCGEVDFFFFSVEGCVTLRLGNQNLPLPPADPLIRGLSLHSRTTNILLPGSGSDQPVDGSLGNAFHRNEQGQFVGAPGATIPVVPIDAIPVLQLEMRPFVPNTCRFGNSTIPTVIASTAWVRRGERFYRYTLQSVELTGADGAAIASPFDEGDTPAVWWDRNGQPVPGSDDDVQLALLNWIPDPVPAAAERTTSRDREINRRWGNVCAEVAPPARVLWSFTAAVPGPAPRGWTLIGMPWPDPAGTVRSSLPPTILTVTEPWRSRDPIADALVAAVPAYISVCRTLREHLLIAPRADRERQPRIRDDDRFDAILSRFPIPSREVLPDGIRFEFDGVRQLRMLTFFQREVGDKVLRGLDVDGKPNGFELQLDANGHPVFSMGDLPTEWKDPTRPWFDTVNNLMTAWQHCFVGPLREPELFFFEVDLPEETAAVEIGLKDEPRDPGPSWGVLLIEAIGAAEIARAEFDQTRRQTTISVLDGALGADQASRALLRPGSLYTMTVRYDVLTAPVDSSGTNADGSSAVALTGQVQQFQFKTDDRPPERLASWVMATCPGPSEMGFFYKDAVRVVFATPATRRLFKAYGRDLWAVVKAASGRHPNPAPDFDAAETPLDRTQIRATNLKPFAASAFESALRETAENLPCVNHQNQENGHELITLQLQLEPCTEYILDLEARPSADLSAYPLFRRNFATSRYPDMPTFASDLASRVVAHRYCPNPGALTALASVAPIATVPDAVFEAALRAARWGDLKRPTSPRITAVWQSAIPAQPIAIYLETTESVWRSRGSPELVNPLDPAGAKRYQLVDQPWLELVESTVGPSRISCFVHTTDGARTLAFLKPASRGSKITLDLKRTGHPMFEGSVATSQVTAAIIDLTKAPWEDAP